jgi:hypothetical protein
MILATPPMDFSDLLPKLGIGIAILLGILFLLWLLLSRTLLYAAQGLPQFLSEFFMAIVSDRLDEAYALTTPLYQKRTSRKQFKQFIKANQLKDYKTSKLPLKVPDTDRTCLDLELEFMSGKTVLLHLELVQVDEQWAIDVLEKGSAQPVE